MCRAINAATVAILSAAVLVLAAVVTFFGVSFYVLTMADPAGMQPGSVQYETREFWLSIDDIRNGRNESWTAEMPNIIDWDSP